MPDQTPGTARLIDAPSEDALYLLLASLNDAGHHPEVACLKGGGPFIAGLWDVDYAGSVHYVVTEADSGQVHCCNCTECRPWCDWHPTFPVTVVLTEDPDPVTLLTDEPVAWWRVSPASTGGDK